MKQTKRMLMTVGILLTLFGSLCLAEKMSERTEGISNMTNDQQIAEDVAAKIRNYVFYDIFDWVDVSVKDGVVTLDGWARQPYHKTEYEHHVKGVRGVKQIKNRIQVLPLSTFDDRVRFQVARRIYDHSILDRYAFQIHPPIHIIVNHGVVILKGMVHSKLEDTLAATLARESRAFRVIDDLQIETKG